MTSCDCSCNYYDHEPASFFTTTWRTARKQHKCCECGDLIKPGTRYEYVAGVWDGEIATYKTCQPCVAIRERYCPHGWIIGGLAEQIEYCLSFDYREVPADDL